MKGRFTWDTESSALISEFTSTTSQWTATDQRTCHNAAPPISVPHRLAPTIQMLVGYNQRESA